MLLWIGVLRTKFTDWMVRMSRVIVSVVMVAMVYTIEGFVPRVLTGAVIGGVVTFVLPSSVSLKLKESLASVYSL
jgi:hypothetical protein